MLNAILSDPPRRLAEVRPDGVFSEDLEQLVQDCLAKKPEDRPASMSEVEARFEECSPDYGLFLSTGAGRTRSRAPAPVGFERDVRSARRPIPIDSQNGAWPFWGSLAIVLAAAASVLRFF